MNEAIHKDINDWVKFPEYDLLWCDPPWGEKMAKYFHTIQKKQTGVEKTTSIIITLTSLAKLANKNKPVFIEYSTEEKDIVIKIMQQYGHKYFHTTNAFQSNKKPYVVLAFNTNYILEDGFIGGDSITRAIRDIKPNIVFDPFAGIGYTARFVLKAGSSYVGAEMNYARYLRLKEVLNA